MNGKNLVKLRELVLIGNPFREREIEKGGNKYVSVIRKMFPSITVLDGVAIPPETEITFDISDIMNTSQTSSVATTPVPTRVGFIDNEETRSIVQTFLTGYFLAFDKNRTTIGNLYCENSVLSICLSITGVGDWMKVGRNILRLKSEGTF